MDKIWDRKSLEVGGHWPLWRMIMQNRQKANSKKNKVNLDVKKAPLIKKIIKTIYMYT